MAKRRNKLVNRPLGYRFNLRGRKMPFRFLDLPAEIRNEIYKYLLQGRRYKWPLSQKPFEREHRDPSGLLLVNHQIREETLPLFYALNDFTIHVTYLGYVRRKAPNFMLTPQVPFPQSLEVYANFHDRYDKYETRHIYTLRKSSTSMEPEIVMQFGSWYQVRYIADFLRRPYVDQMKKGLEHVAASQAVKGGVLGVEEFFEVVDFLESSMMGEPMPRSIKDEKRLVLAREARSEGFELSDYLFPDGHSGGFVLRMSSEEA